MIGLQHIPLLATFFDGVDAALSNRFMRPVPPQEPALTSELCALLDAATQRRERSLKFNVDRLNSSLAALGDDLQFDFRIDTHQHSAKMENLERDVDNLNHSGFPNQF